VSIPQSQIGLFVGDNDMSLNKYIIEKSQNAYSRSHGGEFSAVSVSIVIDGDFGGETVVVAKCTAENDLLLNIVESNIHFHTKNFNRTQSKPSKPFKSNFARLVFKTNMEPQLIGKYIGSSGKNIRMLASELGEICANKGIEASSFRVNIMEEDPDKSPKRFFKIANSSTSNANIIIFVTAQHTGNMRELFLCVRDTMISSVVDCVESANQTHKRDMEPDYDDIYAPEETSAEDSYA